MKQKYNQARFLMQPLNDHSAEFVYHPPIIAEKPIAIDGWIRDFRPKRKKLMRLKKRK